MTFSKGYLLRRLKKIQYFFITVGCLCFFSFQALQNINQFVRKETGTRILYKPTEDAEFPDVTICPKNPYIKENLQKNGVQSINDYRFNGYWLSNDSSKDATEFYREVVVNVKNIIKKIEVILCSAAFYQFIYVMSK